MADRELARQKAVYIHWVDCEDRPVSLTRDIVQELGLSPDTSFLGRIDLYLVPCLAGTGFVTPPVHARVDDAGVVVLPGRRGQPYHVPVGSGDGRGRSGGLAVSGLAYLATLRSRPDFEESQYRPLPRRALDSIWSGCIDALEQLAAAGQAAGPEDVRAARPFRFVTGFDTDPGHPILLAVELVHQGPLWVRWQDLDGSLLDPPASGIHVSLARPIPGVDGERGEIQLVTGRSGPSGCVYAWPHDPSFSNPCPLEMDFPGVPQRIKDEACYPSAAWSDPAARWDPLMRRWRWLSSLAGPIKDRHRVWREGRPLEVTGLDEMELVPERLARVDEQLEALSAREAGAYQRWPGRYRSTRHLLPRCWVVLPIPRSRWLQLDWSGASSFPDYLGPEHRHPAGTPVWLRRRGAGGQAVPCVVGRRQLVWRIEDDGQCSPFEYQDAAGWEIAVARPGQFCSLDEVIGALEGDPTYLPDAASARERWTAMRVTAPTPEQEPSWELELEDQWRRRSAWAWKVYLDGLQERCMETRLALLRSVIRPLSSGTPAPDPPRTARVPFPGREVVLRWFPGLRDAAPPDILEKTRFYFVAQHEIRSGGRVLASAGEVRRARASVLKQPARPGSKLLLETNTVARFDAGYDLMGARVAQDRLVPWHLAHGVHLHLLEDEPQPAPPGASRWNLPRVPLLLPRCEEAAHGACAGGIGAWKACVSDDDLSDEEARRLARPLDLTQEGIRFTTVEQWSPERPLVADRPGEPETRWPVRSKVGLHDSGGREGRLPGNNQSFVDDFPMVLGLTMEPAALVIRRWGAHDLRDQDPPDPRCRVIAFEGTAPDPADSAAAKRGIALELGSCRLRGGELQAELVSGQAALRVGWLYDCVLLQWIEVPVSDGARVDQGGTDQAVVPVVLRFQAACTYQGGRCVLLAQEARNHLAEAKLLKDAMEERQHEVARHLKDMATRSELQQWVDTVIGYIVEMKQPSAALCGGTASGERCRAGINPRTNRRCSACGGTGLYGGTEDTAMAEARRSLRRSLERDLLRRGGSETLLKADYQACKRREHQLKDEVLRAAAPYLHRLESPQVQLQLQAIELAALACDDEEVRERLRQESIGVVGELTAMLWQNAAGERWLREVGRNSFFEGVVVPAVKLVEKATSGLIQTLVAFAPALAFDQEKTGFAFSYGTDSMLGLDYSSDLVSTGKPFQSYRPPPGRTPEYILSTREEITWHDGKPGEAFVEYRDLKKKVLLEVKGQSLIGLAKMLVDFYTLVRSIKSLAEGKDPALDALKAGKATISITSGLAKLFDASGTSFLAHGKTRDWVHHLLPGGKHQLVRASYKATVATMITGGIDAVIGYIEWSRAVDARDEMGVVSGATGMVGGVATCLGSAMILTGVGAPVGATLVAIGTILSIVSLVTSFLKRGELETWVKNSFYGSNAADFGWGGILDEERARDHLCKLFAILAEPVVESYYYSPDKPGTGHIVVHFRLLTIHSEAELRVGTSRYEAVGEMVVEVVDTALHVQDLLKPEAPGKGPPASRTMGGWRVDLAIDGTRVDKAVIYPPGHGGTLEVVPSQVKVAVKLYPNEQIPSRQVQAEVTADF